MPTRLDLPVREPSGATRLISARLDEPELGSVRAWSFLYLHGFGSSQDGDKAAYFHRRALERGLSFCSFDFRGHGESGGSTRGLTLTRNLEDVDRVRQALAAHGYRWSVLLGSSMGGLTGLWYAALNPRIVLAAAHIAPAIDLDRTMAERLGKDGLASWRAEGAMTITNELGSFDLGWGFVEDLRRHPIERLAKRIRTATLLAQGKLDDRIDWRRVAEFAEAAGPAEVELLLFDDGGHRLLAQRGRIWEAICGFLERQGVLEAEAAVRG